MKKNLYIQPTTEKLSLMHVNAICNFSEVIGDEVTGGNSSGTGPVME